MISEFASGFKFSALGISEPTKEIASRGIIENVESMIQTDLAPLLKLGRTNTWIDFDSAVDLVLPGLPTDSEFMEVTSKICISPPCSIDSDDPIASHIMLQKIPKASFLVELTASGNYTFYDLEFGDKSAVTILLAAFNDINGITWRGELHSKLYFDNILFSAEVLVSSEENDPTSIILKTDGVESFGNVIFRHNFAVNIVVDHGNIHGCGEGLCNFHLLDPQNPSYFLLEGEGLLNACWSAGVGMNYSFVGDFPELYMGSVKVENLTAEMSGFRSFKNESNSFWMGDITGTAESSGFLLSGKAAFDSTKSDKDALEYSLAFVGENTWGPLSVEADLLYDPLCSESICQGGSVGIHLNFGSGTAFSLDGNLQFFCGLNEIRNLPQYVITAHSTSTWDFTDAYSDVGLGNFEACFVLCVIITVFCEFLTVF